MPATKADKKSSSTKKKDKSKGESSSKSSKDKPRRSKDKASSKTASGGADAVATAAAPPPAVDPDAVQLFRRYDRSRAGFLTRVDFLQLMRDYSNAPAGAVSSSVAYGRWASRAPLSLTDSRGVPLGYARADRNSEFEAGQLFERYDSDRLGALTLDKFLRFFADFQPQLAAFVQDCAYFGALVTPIASREQAPIITSQSEATDEQPPPTPEQNRQPAPTTGDAGSDRELKTAKQEADVKRQYQAALWKLHKLCKEELDDQRERLVHKMATLRNETAQRQQRARSVDGGAATERSTKRTVRFMQSPGRRGLSYSDDDDDADAYHGADHVNALYEMLETDLDHIDEITRFLRRYLRQGSDVTLREMRKFLAHAPVTQEKAQYLAMKDYGDRGWRRPVRPTSPSRSSSPPASPSAARTRSPQVSPHSDRNRNVAYSSRNQQEHEEEDEQRPQPQQSHRQRELEELVRVKDQMIYQLLQERATMRRDKTAMESYLKTLSRVSSQEMKKWAQLTDEMQEEIERLRAQLTPARRPVPFR